jgi:uncharacterized protein with HEPN domain
MSRDKQSLLDVIIAVRQVLKYGQDLDRLKLENNDEKQAAILYRLVVIGEATKRLSLTFREQNPDIPWRQMAGLRDVVVHEYDGLNLDILWNIVSINLPEILPKLEELQEVATDT